MKHIKFEENIREDDSYNADKVSKGSLVQKVADNTLESEFEVTETKKWYKDLPEEPIDLKPLDSEQIATLKKEAVSIMHGESLAFETKMSKSGTSDQKWAHSLLSKGAMGDRVAAATVLIQDNPIFRLSILRNLVAMVKPAKKKDSLTVIETLSELFLCDLLLPEAKLRVFESRPLSKLEEMSSGNRNHRRKILTNWIFEDQLKEVYGEFIKALNNFAHDTIDTHKEKAVSAMSKLLMHNPELEKVLLASIVNKLGDPSQKVASKVIYHLCQVLYNHPNMKGIVLDEIERMLFRPNISSKAQYYGVCFLNQFYLSKDDTLVAENLVRVYFSFFKACIKKGEIDTRLMSAILTGVKRCQPFLGHQKLEELQQQADALHRLVHLARYNISLHALALLLQIAPVASQLSDRYYCALYKKLADPETLTTTLPALMMNIVYRSIKADSCDERVLAFLKRLLQLSCMCDAPRACAFLLLISRLSRRKKIPKKWIVYPDEDMEAKIKEEELKLENDAKELLKEEENKIEEVVEDNEETNTKKKKKKDKKQKNNDVSVSEEILDDEGKAKNDSSMKSLWRGDKFDLLNDDDEEVYSDVILEEDEEAHKKKLKKNINQTKTKTSWLHRTSNLNDEVETEMKDVDEIKEDEKPPIPDPDKDKELKILLKKTKNMEKVITSYNPFNRNPAYCGAEHSVVSELLYLMNHYHPTVKLFAQKILNDSFIQYSGDPLKDFSIARFLDRFAFKNPKKDVPKNDEAVEPQFQIKNVKGSHPKFAQRKNYLASGLKSLPVNSAAYLNEDASRIPVDERFLYDFLQTRKSDKEEDSGEESDAGSVGSEDFESYLDSLAGKKNLEESDESGNEKEEEEEFDFLNEVMVNKSKMEKKKGKSKDDNDAEEDDNDDEFGSEDEMSDVDDDSDLDFSDDDMKPKKNKKSKDAIDSDVESDLNFSDGEDDGFDVPSMPGKPNKTKPKKKNAESMFASAEEFSTLLEDTGAVKGHGTSQDLSNTDNSHLKQLNWETNRDRWVKGYNDRFQSNKGRQNERKPFGKRDGKFSKKSNDFNNGNKRKFNHPAKGGAKRPRR